MDFGEFLNVDSVDVATFWATVVASMVAIGIAAMLLRNDRRSARQATIAIEGLAKLQKRAEAADLRRELFECSNAEQLMDLAKRIERCEEKERQALWYSYYRNILSALPSTKQELDRSPIAEIVGSLDRRYPRDVGTGIAEMTSLLKLMLSWETQMPPARRLVEHLADRIEIKEVASESAWKAVADASSYDDPLFTCLALLSRLDEIHRDIPDRHVLELVFVCCNKVCQTLRSRDDIGASEVALNLASLLHRNRLSALGKLDESLSSVSAELAAAALLEAVSKVVDVDSHYTMRMMQNLEAALRGLQEINEIPAERANKAIDAMRSTGATKHSEFEGLSRRVTELTT